MLPKRQFVVLAVTAGIFIAGIAENAVAKKQLFGAVQPVVVIDPGHGGKDTGATGPDGSAEKGISLNFARILAAELDRGYKVVLTRTDDSVLHLEKRTALANHHKGDLFISIHTGGSYIHSTSGIRIYYYQDLTEDPLNRSESPPNPAAQPKSPVLWAQAQNRFRENSLSLANNIGRRLGDMYEARDIRILGAPLLVLQGANMPAFLIEIGYLSNPKEEKKLNDQRYLIDLARAIRRGIDEYFEQQE
jgi:N-acetylmuramoyl-L-alanine amidase